MPTIMSHAVAALALGTAFRRVAWPARVWWAGALCAVAPDADVLAVVVGVPLGSVFGHRGLTHSLAFAAVLAAVVAVLVAPSGVRARAWLYLFMATASHGLLDAMTDGGIGVALFAPFDASRHYLPWQPIAVSPLGVRRFLSVRGVAVLQSEAVWVWLPSLVFATAAWLLTRKRRAQIMS